MAIPDSPIDHTPWLQPAVHPVYTRLLCADLRRRGFSQAQILEGTRLDWETLHADNRFLGFEPLRRLLLHAVGLTGRPWLGIEVGQQAQVALHGALGQAVAASGTVGQALALVARYMPLRQRMVSMHIDAGDGLSLVGEEHLMADDVREVLVGYLGSALLHLVETVGGLSLHDDLDIEWPFPEPPWAAQYDRLAVRNSFGHPRLRARLSPALLAHPTLAGDPDALRIAVRECERQLNQQQAGGTLTQRVQRRLADCQGRFPSLDEVANEQAMSARTLIRRLKDEGTSYQQLLDAVREELACWLLLQTTMSVEAIAERLGYGDPSNFSRTFRRWMGMTPREFRATHAQHPGEPPRD